MCIRDRDINGKIANQPIHRLLGTCKESVPVYSSTAFHETKEQYAEVIFNKVVSADPSDTDISSSGLS